MRSAFAAAFLSFLLPGLGHVYLRRWLRALLWMALPVLALVASLGYITTTGIKETLASFVDPDVLTAALLLIALDALYRLAAMLDAWRLARDPLIGTGTTRTASAIGVALIVVVLLGSHVATAMPVRYAQDVLDAFDGGGDTSAIPDISELPPKLRDIVSATAAPNALAAGPEPGDTPSPTVEPWDSDERLDILLVGLDSGRPGERTYLTDTMMVVSIDPASGRMAFISLPRDTVDVPLPQTAEFREARSVFGDAYAGRINTLYITARLRDDLFPGNDKSRGYRALMSALSELYKLDIEHYVAVDLKSFRGAVNALGGVVVDVQVPLFDPAYAAADGRGKLKLYVPPGIQKMNGQESLAYARSRKSTSDFDRSARQQYLVESFKDQVDLETMLEPGVIGELRAQFDEYVTTNIPAKMLPQLVLLATELDTRKPKSLVLSPLKGYGVTQADYDIKPNLSRIRKAVKNVFKTGSKKSSASTAPSPSASGAPSPSAEPLARAQPSPPWAPSPPSAP